MLPADSVPSIGAPQIEMILPDVPDEPALEEIPRPLPEPPDEDRTADVPRRLSTSASRPSWIFNSR